MISLYKYKSFMCLEARVVCNEFRSVSCIDTKDATIDCSRVNDKKRCVQDVASCLQELRTKQPTLEEIDPDGGIEPFPLVDIIAGGVVKASVWAIKFLRVTTAGKYVIKVVTKTGEKIGTVSKSVYDASLKPHLDSMGRVMKKIIRRPKALQKLKMQKELRKARLEKLHYERYTIDGILEIIKRDGLKIIKSESPPFNGYEEYFLSGKNGVLRSVGVMVKDGALSMWMPRSVKGKGYTTALYVALSKKFKLPIVMSKNTTKTRFDNMGNISTRGGDYIWQELKKTGKVYMKNGRTYFDAN